MAARWQLRSGCGIKLIRIVLKWFCFSNKNAATPRSSSAVWPLHSTCFRQTELDRILNNAPLHLILSALMVEPVRSTSHRPVLHVCRRRLQMPNTSCYYYSTSSCISTPWICWGRQNRKKEGDYLVTSSCNAFSLRANVSSGAAVVVPGVSYLVFIFVVCPNVCSATAHTTCHLNPKMGRCISAKPSLIWIGEQRRM